MEHTGVLFDLTEFLRAPMRSGIQRVAFEVVRHWPQGCPLVPMRIGPGQQVLVLPRETLDRMREFFGTAPGDPQAAHDWLVRAGQEAGSVLDPAHLARYQALLNTEVFCDYNQVACYEGLLQTDFASRIFFVIYDMLPWVQPRWFAQAIVTFPLSYLRLLRSVQKLGFISEQTQRDFVTRICRGSRVSGPVLPLGSDGLGTGMPTFDPSRRQFAMIGTLEPRKNVRNVLDAFEALWAEGVDASLVCAGRMGWLEEVDRARVVRLAAEQPRFTWLSAPTDEQLRELILSSRATLYPSWAEGFGLPPVESLALGVPVVVSATLPSVASLPPLGQVRLDVPEAGAIRQAVLQLLDDDFARGRTDEIRGLPLPRWADFGFRLADWVLRGSHQVVGVA